MAQKKKLKVEEEMIRRMKFLRSILADDEKREELDRNILGSEVLIRFEIIFASPHLGEYSDGLFLYMNDEGKIVDAEYYLRQDGELTLCKIEGEDLRVVQELFQDSFTLEVE